MFVTNISDISVWEIFTTPNGRKFQIELEPTEGCTDCALRIDDLCQEIHGCSTDTRADKNDIILKEIA